MEENRFKRGQETLDKLHGSIGQSVMKTLGDFAPDFARYIIEFPYGDIYSRDTLTPKERQIAIISSLTTLGNVPTQLKAHIQAALNVGCTRQEVVEIIMQMAVYAGFPSAINAILVAKEVFAELDSAAASHA